MDSATAKKRRTADSDSLCVTVHPPGPLPAVQETCDDEGELRLAGDVLAALVHPLSPSQFVSSFWQRRALLVKAPDASISRLGPRLRAELDFGDLEDLMERSPSELIHVWLPNKGGGPAESFQCEPSAAMACFRSGVGSLYFRAPQNVIDLFVPAIGCALGAAHATWAADTSLAGEIETFVSRPGKVTDWHSDFQNNWTLQLHGRKRWRLKRSHLPLAPLRGFTPHFAAGVSAAQWTSARINGGEWTHEAFADEEECVVELGPGDMFYHPAGILHRVETVGEEDSISINISLDLVRPADYLADVVRGLLRRSEVTRAPLVNVRGAESDRRSHLQGQLDELKRVVAQLTVEAVFPPALFQTERLAPRDVFLDQALDSDLAKVAVSPIVKRNLLATLLPLADNPHGPCFSIVFNTGGEELEAWARVNIFPGDKKLDSIVHLMSVIESSDQSGLNVEAVCASSRTKERLFKVLLHYGYLVDGKRFLK